MGSVGCQEALSVALPSDAVVVPGTVLYTTWTNTLARIASLRAKKRDDG
jgi:hypothetical protein